jgi:hypothetical protein
MTRSLGHLDLIIAVGLIATVLGGGLLYVAADGILQAPSMEAKPIERSVDSISETGWLQPVLGRTIVENSSLENHATESIPSAAAELNRAVLANQWLQQARRGQAAFLRTYADRLEAEHAGRIQTVKGRSIVNFTSRGIRTGLLSANQPVSAFNRRMIGMTDAMGRRMDEEFANKRQPTLGQAIVASTQDLSRLDERVHEWMGRAIVQLTKTTAAYQDARSAGQEQLGSLVVAAVRAEQQSKSLARPAGDTSREVPVEVVSDPKEWPEIPFTYLIAGSGGLIGLFIAGLILAPRRPEEEIVIEESIPGVVSRVYRKAV